MLEQKKVLDALQKIEDPLSKKDIVSANLVKSLRVNENEITFILEIDPRYEVAYREVKSVAEKILNQLGHSVSAKIYLTSHSSNGEKNKSQQVPDLKIGRHPSTTEKKIKPLAVKKIIAIGSGKGGVGKSTVSANLAVALSGAGLKVGLLDADIYGPSQPMMMGIEGKPKIGGVDGKRIIPLKSFGVTIMSIGFLVPPKEAIVWRGPMLMGTLQQFIGQVDWGELDILLVDLPPGTGDVQLTLAQKCELDGAIIVSTSQDVALIDAMKAMHMFYKLNVPLIGLIENMSTYVCRKCGHEEHLFGTGGLEAESTKSGVDFLGKIPLHIDIMKSTDMGRPCVHFESDSSHAKPFKDIAKTLSQYLNLVPKEYGDKLST